MAQVLSSLINPLCPWKPAEEGKLKPKTKTMVLVLAMGRVKGIFALSNEKWLSSSPSENQL